MMPVEAADDMIIALRSAAIYLPGPLPLATHNYAVLGEAVLPAVALELGVHVLLLGIADAEIGDQGPVLGHLGDSDGD